MKKIVSVSLSIVIFISVIVLTLILNINFMIDSNTIDKISKDLDYLGLVDIQGESSKIKNYYDDLYSLLQENDVSQETISKIYKTDFFNLVTSLIVSKGIDSILTVETDKYYFKDPNSSFTKEELDTLLEEELEKAGINDDKILDLMKDNNSNIIKIEKVVRNGISMVIGNNIVKYILSYPFKIILVCLTTILIIILYLMNKEKYLPYIFVPVILASILSLFLSLFLGKIIFYLVSDNFLLEFINPFVKPFTRNLLFSSLILLFISVIYLMINEGISNINKRIIKPKIKMRKNIDDIM